MHCYLSTCVGLVLMVFNLENIQGGTSLVSNYEYRDDKVRTKDPVIGILTQEATGMISEIAQGQYVLETYVKMIKDAGGKVVPFRVNQTPKQIEKMFNSINGVVIPGGHVKLHNSLYATVGKQIYDLTIKANEKGTVFPLWGECLGLEIVALLASGRGLTLGQYDTALLDYTFALNFTAPLIFSNNEYKKSKLFGHLPPKMLTFMKTKLRSWNNHNKAITPEKFWQNKPLSDMFRVLTTNKDRIGKVFISTMEAKKYPIFLFHWHPSKAQLDLPDNPNNTPEAKENARFLAKVFLDEARKNDHVFSDPEALIDNCKDCRIVEEADAYFMPL